MSSTLVYDAIKARLVDTLGGTYPIRDWEEIEVSLQRETAPWISIEDGGGNNELNSVGSPDNNWVTDSGFIDVHVMVPSTGSLSPARSIAEQVRDVLLYQHLTLQELPPQILASPTLVIEGAAARASFMAASATAGRLRVLAVDPPDTGFIHDGLWHSMRVTLNYEHLYTRATAA